MVDKKRPCRCSVGNEEQRRGCSRFYQTLTGPLKNFTEIYLSRFLSFRQPLSFFTYPQLLFNFCFFNLFDNGSKNFFMFSADFSQDFAI